MNTRDTYPERYLLRTEIAISSISVGATPTLAQSSVGSLSGLLMNLLSSSSGLKLGHQASWETRERNLASDLGSSGAFETGWKVKRETSCSNSLWENGTSPESSSVLPSSSGRVEIFVKPWATSWTYDTMRYIDYNEFITHPNRSDHSFPLVELP